ncbi:SHOCT domain-containing protein [Arthrobacter sp. 131MFCol6.1]|jgi:ABC-type multidrug transport system fused ATPase/permease subunit|uniref:SHOCT domain-containing protein n=1 Tax=Arthrobacter sp. 131MFCol6.1 TaxID=1157944 RepID=UPI0005B79963|nr:SHOCT domain-containing protein [Arthrobacter sp. 131MFCol6.1]
MAPVEQFWNFIWLFFWSFAFIAYLFALFAVITDIFRDHELSGWLKAVWVIFLIFVPFLTVLVYLIARGRSMAERQARSAQQAEAATTEYIRSVATASPSQEIAKAKELLDAGTLTQSEFDAVKAKALSRA